MVLKYFFSFLEKPNNNMQARYEATKTVQLIRKPIQPCKPTNLNSKETATEITSEGTMPLNKPK